MADWDKLMITRCLDHIEGAYVHDMHCSRYLHTGVKAPCRALTKKWLPPMCLDIDCFALHPSTSAALDDVVFLHDLYGDRSPHTFHYYCDGSGGVC